MKQIVLFLSIIYILNIVVVNSLDNFQLKTIVKNNNNNNKIKYNNSEGQLFSYFTLYNESLSYYSAIVNWNSYNNLITDFFQWEQQSLLELIDYAHTHGVAVHHMVSADCNSENCAEYFSSSHYEIDINYMVKMGGDGFHMDIEGTFSADEYKSSWTKSAYQYLKSVNSKYVSSLAVSCEDPKSFNTLYTDYYILMCYDMGWSANPLTLNSPTVQVRLYVQEWKLYVKDAMMIVIGLPLYSYYGDCESISNDHSINSNSNNLFGKSCYLLNGKNNNTAVGINAIYSLQESYQYISYQSNPTGEPFVNVVYDNSTMSVRQYQFDSPSSLNDKVIDTNVGGVAVWRVDNLIGLPESIVNSYYYSISPSNL